MDFNWSSMQVSKYCIVAYCMDNGPKKGGVPSQHWVDLNWSFMQVCMGMYCMTLIERVSFRSPGIEGTHV